MKTIKKILLALLVTVLFITVFESCQKEPTASFTVSSTSIEVGESVYFTNTSADADSYEWKFGDGSTSSSISPTYTYNTAGTYSVTLTAFSKNGKKSDKATETITVTISWQCGDPFTDSRDGQTYQTVQIGSQCWMAENLNYYTSSGSWYYDNDSITYAATYGRLYDWATALTVAPAGWHLPTDAEWTVLTAYLGGESVAGGKMKETGTTHWNSPNTGATNESGFTALPGGSRLYSDGSFCNLGNYAHFWTATESDASHAWYRTLRYDVAGVNRYNQYKTNGFSVRCLKD